ncbi:MAG: hypothetical protein KBA33_09310 [Cloacibacterium sp.]|nr:hypothetical protein [Cloacibacterium sp.]
MQTGGVPLTNDLMNHIQTAYEVFNGLGGIAGNLTILDGCTDNGGQISSGVVFINGEVLRFEGGYVSEKVFIYENQIKKQFKSGESKILIKERSVRFGNAASDVYNWADFVRIEKLKDLQTKINAKAEQSTVRTLLERVNVLERKAGVFQAGGGMVFWNKPANLIPVGWQEVVDWRSRMPVGWNPDDLDFDTVGKMDGEKTHTLKPNELPIIDGAFDTIAFWSQTATGVFEYTYSVHAIVGGSPSDARHKGVKFKLGGDQPHNNMPPYRVVMFIEYIG